MPQRGRYIVWLEDIGRKDAPRVGIKNACLGEIGRELSSVRIQTPRGFAVTADAYRRLLETNGLRGQIQSELARLRRKQVSFRQAGSSIRRMIMAAGLPGDVKGEMEVALHELVLRSARGPHDAGLHGGRSGDGSGRRGTVQVPEHKMPYVAVRSSPTADGFAVAVPAGLHDSFAKVCGDARVADACLRCYSSVFSDRAIFYREKHGIDHLDVKLAVGIQQMVRSDLGASGVLHTLHGETGFPDLVLISGAWGLGGSVVDGLPMSDEYVVYKPFLEDRGLKPVIGRTLGAKETRLILRDGSVTVRVETSSRDRCRFVLGDNETLALARWAVAVEDHYDWPMEIEWAKDGESGDVFVVQAKPQTVRAEAERGTLRSYDLERPGEVLARGAAVGAAVAVGRALVLAEVTHAEHVERSDVLVAPTTDASWLPIMRQAGAVVTDKGGPGSHTASACRELGLPAVTGTGNASSTVKNGQIVTVSSAEGETGYVYKGTIGVKEAVVGPEDVPEIHTSVLLNIGSPEAALKWWNLPVDGICPARTEFITGNIIRIHPLALIHFDQVEDRATRDRIAELTFGYEEKAEYFVDRLAENLAQIAASQHPQAVIVRFSDFSSRQYESLIGGPQFESHEENPAMGLRGPSRYLSDLYRPAFELECRALRRVREEMGFTNAGAMIPFCRTPEEADAVQEVLRSHGLVRGDGGFEIHMTIEVPSNVVMADKFVTRFDALQISAAGFERLAAAPDDGSPGLPHGPEHMEEAIRTMVLTVLKAARVRRVPVGFCGPHLGGYPDLVEFLVGAGIDSLSVTPYNLITVIERIDQAESRRNKGPSPRES